MLGFIMLLPLIAWAVTGALFFVKPGWAKAYGPLRVRDRSDDSDVWIHLRPQWKEMRTLSTIPGRHLLVRTSEGWAQLDPSTLAPRPEPTEQEIRDLIGDAIAEDSARYGEIVSVDSAGAVKTTTGATITLDWTRMTLSQRGRDTDRIDFFYRVHYLQWTGFERVDRVLGLAGILLTFGLAGFGARLLLLRPVIRP